MSDQRTCPECFVLLNDQGLCAPGCRAFPPELIEARVQADKAADQYQVCLTECVLPLKARLLADGFTITEHVCDMLAIMPEFSAAQSPAAGVPPDDRGCSEPI